MDQSSRNPVDVDRGIVADPAAIPASPVGRPRRASVMTAVHHPEHPHSSPPVPLVADPQRCSFSEQGHPFSADAQSVTGVLHIAVPPSTTVPSECMTPSTMPAPRESLNRGNGLSVRQSGRESTALQDWSWQRPDAVSSSRVMGGFCCSIANSVDLLRRLNCRSDPMLRSPPSTTQVPLHHGPAG